MRSTTPGLENRSTWSIASSPKVPAQCVCVCVCNGTHKSDRYVHKSTVPPWFMFYTLCIMQIWILHGPHSEKRLYPDLIFHSMAQLIEFFNWAVREIHNTDQTENAMDRKSARVCVCVYVHEREKKRGREKERDWPHKLEGPLGKAYVVLTANLRKMSITLSTSKTFMKASRLYQSLPPHQLPQKYFLSEKISFNYWKRCFKFISVFQDFLQIAVQSAVVHIKMILLILTCFPCCKQTDCQKPQICCLQWKACDASQRQLFADAQETFDRRKHRYDTEIRGRGTAHILRNPPKTDNIGWK